MDADGVLSSRLLEWRKSIVRFHSEDLFLYHQLLDYSHAPNSDAMVIFNLGNMARPFFEGYVAFKFLEFGSMDNPLSSLILDPVKRELARKFMHHYSHTHSHGGGMKLPDMAEARKAVTAILEGIERHNPVHFAALRDAA
ncbi:hypothetical protein J5277_17920 [Rhizobium sp. 16-449-1b]|nr:hypothetical protein [Rhizobium sp. 16-449-1b]